MWKFVIGVVLSGAAAFAQQWSICLQDRVGLNSFTLRAFETEFRSLGGEAFTRATCSYPAIAVVISAYPPARQANALGLAYRRDERVLPELRIFTQPVLRIVGERASATQIGRALARVAAHELGHYTRQQLHHDHKGLMRAAFQADQLARESSRPFRPKD